LTGKFPKNKKYTMKMFRWLLLSAFLLAGWGALPAHELDSTTAQQDQETELSIVVDWDGLKTYAVAAKRGKKGTNGKKGGSKGKKGGNAKKGGAKGKKCGKTRCIRVIRGKGGRIIRVFPCPKGGRRPKSGR
jgi:hypothetical protein